MNPSFEKFLTNEPFYNFTIAIDEYGFDFNEVSQYGFKIHLKSISVEYETIRKTFLSNDLLNFRKITHKLKGVFL